jgi:MATE family multidrug resistance protein
VLWATLLPLVAVMAYQLDGIFIGATEGALMRNAMLVSSGIYFPLSYAMAEGFGNHGLWAAIWVYLALRAATLAVSYPRLESRLRV